MFFVDSDIMIDIMRHSLGFLDAIIGLTAAKQNLPLYTFNEKHYNCIETLQILKPYKRKL